MTIRHLQIFVTICQENSFSLAGERLNMAQPAVSLAIKELESFYGVTLFERMNRRIYITDAGSKLLEYANNILTQLGESIHCIRNNDICGIIRIGANVTVGETLLPLAMKLFHEKSPDITIKTFIENSKQIELLLSNNQIDIAIADNVSISANFITESIFKEKMAVVCTPSYWKDQPRSIPLSRLAKEPLLLREKGSGTRNSIDQIFQIYNLALIPAVESISSLSLLNIAKANLGITILSRYIVRESIENGSLIELEITDAQFLRNYFMIYHRQKNITPIMHNFISTIKKHIHDSAEPFTF
jgi:DNA-binding transcriptional LysR family regulator